MSFRTQVAAGVTVAVIITGLHLGGAGATVTAAHATAAGSGRVLIAAPAVPDATVSCGDYGGTALTREGDDGARVREVQCLLAFRGWFGGTVDGRYGNSTYLAVRAYQSWDDLRGCAVRLKTDGIVDPLTWSALRSGDGCPNP